MQTSIPERRLSAIGKLPSDIDGDTPPTPIKCPSCRASLDARDKANGECCECGKRF